jgi:hypothetical protein
MADQFLGDQTVVDSPTDPSLRAATTAPDSAIDRTHGRIKERAVELEDDTHRAAPGARPAA